MHMTYRVDRPNPFQSRCRLCCRYIAPRFPLDGHYCEWQRGADLSSLVTNPPNGSLGIVQVPTTNSNSPVC